ncbi:MAG: hypothetical protein IKO01_09230 [Kiritimatiellae bacterium]|nr:hypothetical protein [Kiritimatiellia bacterium]
MKASSIKAVWAAIGCGSPEPEPCPTCYLRPIVTIICDEDGYVGHIECSPDSRKIRGLLDPGTHKHFDFSAACKTPEEAYDAAVETWNAHLSALLPRGERFPAAQEGGRP